MILHETLDVNLMAEPVSFIISVLNICYSIWENHYFIKVVSIIISILIYEFLVNPL